MESFWSEVTPKPRGRQCRVEGLEAKRGGVAGAVLY
jgi:hypothetical protein